MVPKNSVPLDKRSPTYLVPLDKCSQKFGPPGKMVPNQFGALISGSPQPVLLDKQNIQRTICPGGPNWLGTEFLGTICPWGMNWLATICPEGPINRGPIVGDQMSGDHLGLGPNVSQPRKVPLTKQACDRTSNILVLKHSSARTSTALNGVPI